MRTADMIKSKFWRAGDLQGQPPVVLTIADVTEELLGRGARQDVKCFLWFTEHLKGLQLNKTRVRTLEAAYGPDSDLWVGKRVRLTFDPTVEFGGRAVGGVRLQTPPGVIYTPGAELHAGWGTGPTPEQLHPPGSPHRPPPPVWDEKRQMWITPAPPPAAHRPPPPVWNDATQSWETVHPGTGEIAPVAHQRAPTISERVNQSHPPATDFGPLPPAGQPEFDDDIPF